MKPTGFILYDGPSLIDDRPIVAIAIVKSKNDKTGNMVQTYILRSDIAPTLALKSGDDSSVCGRCKHRPIFGGKCYVNVGHGPLAVFNAYKRGNYPRATDTATLGVGRMVRLGTYGDPYAVPADVWQALISRADGHTGYTHQWLRMRSSDLAAMSQARALRDIVMASVDDPAEHALARQDGWRTFRVRGDDSEPLLPREFVCPASHESGKRLHCAECGACDGAGKHPNAATVTIVVHGPRAPRRTIQIRSAA
jgi:hypothetical protein